MAENISNWLSENLPVILARLGAAIAIMIAAIVVGRLTGRWARRALEKRGKRTGTFGSVIRDACMVIFVCVGIIMALDQVGLDVATLLAGAGILGLAVGFGAQSLVKDVISGFFLILDGALAEGDIVKLPDVTGTVENVGLRTTQVRTFDGQLWYVQNGEIRALGNFSREWARAIVEVGLAYEQDATEGLRVLQEVGAAYAEEHPDGVLEPPEAQGLLSLGDSAVTVRLVVKVQAADRFAAERELRARVKKALDAANIEIPFPRQVVYHRMDPDGEPLRHNELSNGDGAARRPVPPPPPPRA